MFWPGHSSIHKSELTKCYLLRAKYMCYLIYIYKSLISSFFKALGFW